MIPSKTNIDKIGKVLLQPTASDADKSQADAILGNWRQLHLTPLTEVTLKLQEWLQALPSDFFVAQRLKRKPQIICKLKRSYPMRLSQMQDIGGCRAILQNGNDLNEAWKLIKEKSRHKYFSALHDADYRDKGRDESGYRAVHVIVDRNGFKIEIQLRTLIEHAWAEEVERTSIICQSPLKEGQGPPELIQYFHITSDALTKLEKGQPIPHYMMQDIVDRRRAVDSIIGETRRHLLSGFEINKQYIRGLEAKEQGLKIRRRMTNWILIFNWEEGTFQHWAHVETNPEKASSQYSSFEKQWKFEDGYEVVLIGAKSVSTIQQTHSHYFGISTYDDYIQQITNQRPYGADSVLSNGAMFILDKMRTKRYWKTKRVSYKTLRNHYCASLDDFERALEELTNKGFILTQSKKGPFTLNLEKKADIESILN